MPSVAERRTLIADSREASYINLSGRSRPDNRSHAQNIRTQGGRAVGQLAPQPNIRFGSIAHFRSTLQVDHENGGTIAAVVTVHEEFS